MVPAGVGMILLWILLWNRGDSAVASRPEDGLIQEKLPSGYSLHLRAAFMGSHFVRNRDMKWTICVFYRSLKSIAVRDLEHLSWLGILEEWMLIKISWFDSHWEWRYDSPSILFLQGSTCLPRSKTTGGRSECIQPSWAPTSRPASSK